ncbi:50S ribosomal protein L15 [Patescibacteria group bacterium]|nr:50S ribosomal protein L15 [Patescibacteria group bacterium]
MQYSLSNLKRPKTAKRPKKRVGRGNASGKGTYSGKGLKGQRARSGGRQGLAKRALFKQLLMRTPKLRGFKRASAEIAIVNLSDLNDNFKEGDKVTALNLFKKGLIGKAKGGVKVLGNGTIKKKLFVHAHYFSKSAKDSIEKAGGKVEIFKK